MPLDVEQHAQELLTQGYTMVPNVMTPAEVAEARAALDEVFEKEKDLALERGWRNDTHHVAFMLVQKHPFFRQVPTNPFLLSLMRRLLGDDCILATLNGMTMMPGGKPQPLHLDQEMHVPGVILNINALHTLDEFTKANGCTRVVPFSQKRDPGTPITPEDEQKAVYIEAPPGSIIAFNGGAVHAGSANSTNKPRRCLHAYFCRAWVRPHWDFKKSLTPDVASTLTEDQKRLFGFHSGPQWYDVKTHRVTRE